VDGKQAVGIVAVADLMVARIPIPRSRGSAPRSPTSETDNRPRERSAGTEPPGISIAAPQRVRCAVVGVGHIAPVAVLPGFANAENAELAALASDDPTKLRELGRRSDVPP
jgi:hypothetical protein